MSHLLWPSICVALIVAAPPLIAAETPLSAASAAPVRPAEPLAAGQVLSLPDAIARALNNNPEMRVSQAELDASHAARMQANALPNPEFSVLMEDLRAGRRTTTVQLSERLEIGGKRQARNQVATSVVAIAQAEQAAKQQELRAAVTDAFYQALAAQDRIKLTQSALLLAQRVHDAALRRLAAGKVAPIEGSKALVAQASAQLEVSQARSELRVASDKLAGLLGLARPDFTALQGSLQSLPAPLNWEQLEPRLQDSPELQRAGHEWQRRQADIERQRSLRVPDITVSAGVKRDEVLGENMAVVGVSLPIPLFQQNQGGLLEAVRRADKAQAERQTTYLRHRGQLLQALERFNNARDEAESLQLQVLPAATNAHELASKGYELGKFNILDVLDAQRSLFQIQAQYLRVMLEVHRNAAEIERITGGAAHAMAAAAPSVKQE